ncbi:MAG: peptidase MA family metallohydrolase [Nitrospirota bacterium]
MAIDYSKMDRTPFDLPATLKHELCHLILHTEIQSSNLPKWLDEGVAQWASGGIADIINPENKDILKQAVLSGSLPPLNDIQRTFPAAHRGLILSYQESRSFIEFIVSEYGEDKLISIMHSLKSSLSIENAVLNNLGEELNMLEQKWRKNLVKKYSWPTYIADHIYWILFFTAALITLTGYIMFRRRMRDYRDEEEEGFYEN